VSLGDLCKSRGESSNVNLQARSFVFENHWSDIFSLTSFPVLQVCWEMKEEVLVLCLCEVSMASIVLQSIHYFLNTF